MTITNSQKGEKIMTMRKNESGRSLVEMLGVLAIMGILTVGGIAGFNYAMTRHYANEIISAAKERAIIGASQKLQGSPLSLGEFPETIGAYPVVGYDEGFNHEANLFSIKVSLVPKDVCQMVLTLDWQVPVAVYTNDSLYYKGGNTDNLCDAETNDITFCFDNDLSRKQFVDAGNDTCSCGGKTGDQKSVYTCNTNPQNGFICCAEDRKICAFENTDTTGLILADQTNCPTEDTHLCDSKQNCVCMAACPDSQMTQDPTTCECSCPAGMIKTPDEAKCVECNVNTDCPDTEICNTTSNTCETCMTAFQAVMPLKQTSYNFANELDICNDSCNQNFNADGDWVGGYYADYSSPEGIVNAKPSCRAVGQVKTANAVSDSDLQSVYGQAIAGTGNGANYATAAKAMFGEGASVDTIRSKLNAYLANYNAPPSGKNWLSAQSWCRAQGGAGVLRTEYRANNYELQMVTFFMQMRWNLNRFWGNMAYSSSAYCASEAYPSGSSSRWQCNGADAMGNNLYFLCHK